MRVEPSDPVARYAVSWRAYPVLFYYTLGRILVTRKMLRKQLSHAQMSLASNKKDLC
jgi:hypothetical protein